MDAIKGQLSLVKSFVDSFVVCLWAPLSIPTVNLNNKRALVSGANVGVGKAIATSLAAQNAEVHLLCRSKAKADAAKDEIISQTGNTNVFVHVVDFSSLKDVAHFVHRWGQRDIPERRIDILINNAGQ